MVFLQWANIKDYRLIYKLDKTKSDFNIRLREEAIEILDYYRANPQSENTDYVFPIIHKYSLTEI